MIFLSTGEEYWHLHHMWKRFFVTIGAAHRKGFEITESEFLGDKRAAGGNIL